MTETYVVRVDSKRAFKELWWAEAGDSRPFRYGTPTRTSTELGEVVDWNDGNSCTGWFTISDVSQEGNVRVWTGEIAGRRGKVTLYKKYATASLTI